MTKEVLNAKIAILNSQNSDPEMVAMMEEVLSIRGFSTSSTYLDDLLQHKDKIVDSFRNNNYPHTLIFDIAPPYVKSWTGFLNFYLLDGVKDRNLIVTTTDPNTISSFVENSEAKVTVFGLPSDIEKLYRFIRRYSYKRNI